MKIRTKRMLSIISMALFASLAFIIVVVNTPLEGSVIAQSKATPTPPPTPTPAAASFDQVAALAKLREQIKGKENDLAPTVFKNIQTMKNTPAGRLLAVMEQGFAKSLGVNCTHCHVPDKWEAEDKTQKQTARDMSAMVSTINRELLKNIKNLKSEMPLVNCTTCHRGEIKPALNMAVSK